VFLSKKKENSCVFVLISEWVQWQIQDFILEYASKNCHIQFHRSILVICNVI
jgi:hypothetical protein